METLLLAVNAFAIGNFLLIGAFLWFRTPVSKANRALALLIAIPAFPFFSNTLFYVGGPDAFPLRCYVAYFTMIVSLCFGPLLLYFYRTLRQQKMRWLGFHLAQSLWLLVPAFLLFFKNRQELQEVDATMLRAGDPYINIANTLLAFHIFTYIGYALRENRKALNHVPVGTKPYFQLRWAQKFGWVILALNLISFLIVIVWKVVGWEPAMLPYGLVTPLLAAVMYGVVLRSNIQQSLFLEAWTLVETNSALRAESGKLDEPLKTALDVKAFQEKLDALIYAQKPFTDMEFDLPKLASLLGLPAHQVSALLNQGLGVSFSEYIGRQRVEEARARLIDPALMHLTVEAIGYDCGFGSKASFYRVFRQYADLSPAEYRRQAMPVHA